MGIAQVPASNGKTRYAKTLTSGTSYTVPDGVIYLNVILFGGGGGGGNGSGMGGSGGTTTFTGATSALGGPGGTSMNATVIYGQGATSQQIASTLSVTAGASITYAIGAGGVGGTSGGPGVGWTAVASANGVSGGFGSGAGGAGKIEVEYWV